MFPKLFQVPASISPSKPMFTLVSQNVRALGHGTEGVWKRHAIRDLFTKLNPQPAAEWIMGGDFNSMESLDDQIGGSKTGQVKPHERSCPKHKWNFTKFESEDWTKQLTRKKLSGPG
ncbi:hypothetical protein M758_UG225900 [Ceratodon purpureus]|nr:hypothetical protein M758_UG225900 [Ceratodon purpureus]